MNTAMSESVIDTMVKPISRALWIAAAMGERPSSRWRTVFSMTTTASSTTKPVASVSATVTAGMTVAQKAAQKEKDHHHHQRDREQQRELHVLDGSADGRGAIGNHIDLDRRRNRSPQHRQHRFDAIDSLDDVGAGLTLDDQDDSWLFLVPRGEPVVLRPVDRFADILHAHRRDVAIVDNQ